MTNWLQVINKIAPTARPSIAQGLAEAMPKVIRDANLTTNLRLAHFLAQIAHESAGFKTTIEYASGTAYNNRKDLGNTRPGDGPKFKGRGLIQVTGRNNYEAMSKALGEDFIEDPTELGSFPWAALSAAVYWKTNDLNRYADRNDIKKITKAINGGYNGLSDRERYFNLAQSALLNSDISVDPEGIDIRSAQARLSKLNYPLGRIDGIAGYQTQSAVRDFQAAMDEPITGKLDSRTYDLLMSNAAKERPVTEDRKNISAEDLKEQGSTIISATEDLKKAAATAGTALAGASGVAAQVSDVKDKVLNIKGAVETGQEGANMIGQYWQTAVIIVLLIVLAYCIYKCWNLAAKVENERVRQARSGENLRI